MSKDTKNQKEAREEQSETKKYRRQNIYFNSSNDDLYDHFSKQTDKTSYIMKLIRRDLEQSESSEQNLNDLKSDVQDLKSMMQDVLNKLDNVSVVERNGTTIATKETETIDEVEYENPGLKINSEFGGLLLD